MLIVIKGIILIAIVQIDCLSVWRIRNNSAYLTADAGRLILEIIPGSNKHDKRLYDGFNHGFKKSRLILGGDIDEPPGMVKGMENEESRRITAELWNKGLSIPEAINEFGKMEQPSDDSVLDNILHESTGNTDKGALEIFQEFKTPPPGLVQLDDVVYDEDSDTTSGSIREVKEALPARENGPQKKPISSVPETTASIDDRFDELMDEFDVMDTNGGVYDIDFGDLSDTEIRTIRTMMEELTRNPDGNFKEILLRGIDEDGTVEYSREQLLGLVDRLQGIAKLLLKLNSNVNRNPLDIDWIFVIEDSIHKFIQERSFNVSFIKWTEDSIMVTLKEKGLSENVLSELQDSLYLHIKTLSRNNVFYGLQNIGLLLSDSNPDD